MTANSPLEAIFTNNAWLNGQYKVGWYYDTSNTRKIGSTQKANNRIPAIVDQAPADGGEPLSLFESGAILLYLAEKTGQFLPKDLRGRQMALQWLFWQMGGLGPMAGQNHHFNRFAPEKIPYAIKRYTEETARLYRVLNKQLEGREFVAGAEYSIADMAIYPWIVPHEWQGQNLDDFPALKAWFQRVKARPATERAYALVNKINPM